MPSSLSLRNNVSGCYIGAHFHDRGWWMMESKSWKLFLWHQIKRTLGVRYIFYWRQPDGRRTRELNKLKREPVVATTDDWWEKNDVWAGSLQVDTLLTSHRNTSLTTHLTSLIIITNNSFQRRDRERERERNSLSAPVLIIIPTKVQDEQEQT